MSNIDNFDIDKVSSNSTQRQYFVCYFYCKKISIQGSLDDGENANCLLFHCPPYMYYTSTTDPGNHLVEADSNIVNEFLAEKGRHLRALMNPFKRELETIQLVWLASEIVIMSVVIKRVVIILL